MHLRLVLGSAPAPSNLTPGRSSNNQNPSPSPSPDPDPDPDPDPNLTLRSTCIWYSIGPGDWVPKLLVFACRFEMNLSPSEKQRRAERARGVRIGAGAQPDRRC